MQHHRTRKEGKAQKIHVVKQYIEVDKDELTYSL